jgi:murein DD-endopeptidase MepM/ murein hydrolase activator NlpD
MAFCMNGRKATTLNSVTDRFRAKKEDVLLWPGNNLDITNPVFQPGAMIMIPGGYRVLRPWVIAVTASNQAGVNAKISGPGSCTPVGGALGSGSFVWPTSHQGQVSGNDYWEGHRALDMMCYQGDAIFASDSGVVIYSGSIGGGYGNLVAIDHGNGWLSLYAHLSTFNVACGQSVSRGQVIAACGNTGNSTGAHLHFEVRKGSSFYNPWQVLQ